MEDRQHHYWRLEADLAGNSLLRLLRWGRRHWEHLGISFWKPPSLLLKQWLQGTSVLETETLLQAIARPLLYHTAGWLWQPVPWRKGWTYHPCCVSWPVWQEASGTPAKHWAVLAWRWRITDVQSARIKCLVLPPPSENKEQCTQRGGDDLFKAGSKQMQSLQHEELNHALLETDQSQRIFPANISLGEWDVYKEYTKGQKNPKFNLFKSPAWS